jgi:hypothetical protein
MKFRKPFRPTTRKITPARYWAIKEAVLIIGFSFALNAVTVLFPQLPCLVARVSTADCLCFDATCLSFEMKSGLKKSRLVANGKLLTIRSQPLSTMSDISTMTKFRAEQALVARLTARAE